MPETLDEIGLRNGTDKASIHHNYLSYYESYLAPLRDAPITLLEIGVYQGASLRTWREYFPNAKIIGVDITVNCLQFATDRIKIELADQSNLEHLAQLAATYGPFDVIIEDGSHLWDHQIATLRALFPHLKNGGYYVVEDLQTNYGAMAPKYRGLASESCVEFLKRWTDYFVADDLIDLATIEDPFLRTYGRAVDFITFHRRACVLRKKFIPTDWRVSSGPPLAPLPADRLNLIIIAHVGLRGDIFGGRGYVDEGADKFTIQGLELQSASGAIEYRVRYPEGIWSEWVEEGKFAGTRGQSRAVTGFAARVAEPLRRSYDLTVTALFADGFGVETHAGEDCVAPNAAPLRGVQLTLRHARAG